MNIHKLGIIVPYRNREMSLDTFKKHMILYLTQFNIQYEIIIVSQDNANLFNRGMLLNIGFKYAKRSGCDYVVFHDVDMLPYEVDYNYSDVPLHLATNFKNSDRKVIDSYFGGVTMFPIRVFQQINGYSNKYWGWGFEDDDLLLRCKKHHIPLDTVRLTNNGVTDTMLKFNGKDAYVRGKNTIDLTKDNTFFISFCPSDLYFDPNYDSDTYTIFSIPGYDFAISYTSFLRYNFCTFDDELNPYYINSEIMPAKNVMLCVKLDTITRKVRMYIDGVYIGETKVFDTLFDYEEKRHFFIGCGDPKRMGDERHFSGYFSSFAVFEKCVDDIDIADIKNVSDIATYAEDNKPLIFYSADEINSYTLTDLSGNGNTGIILRCEVVESKMKSYTEFKIPHRRQSTFTEIPHPQNGFFQNKWKDKATRWNQLRYNNEVLNDNWVLTDEGLSDLKFLEYGKHTEGNVTYINVGI